MEMKIWALLLALCQKFPTVLSDTRGSLLIVNQYNMHSAMASETFVYFVNRSEIG